MTIPRATTVLALTVSCLLPAACTSPSTTSSPPPAPSSPIARPVTKTNFIADASAACRTSNSHLSHAAQQAFGQHRPTAATWRAFMTRTALPIITHRLDTIAALPRPSADQDTTAAIIRAGHTAVAAATNEPRLLSPASPEPFGTYDRLAIQYGIPTCSVGN